MELPAVYILTNKSNGKRYVGQTCNGVAQRITGHFRNNSYIGRALRKRGLDGFDIQQITYAAEDLNYWERYFIAKLETKHPNGYNFTAGGEGVFNPPQEVRDKMVAAHTPERRKKNSERFSGDKNPMMRPGVAEKVRIANTGKTLSAKTRENMSLASKGNPKGEAHKARISNSLMGHAVSPEVREAIRIAKTGVPLSPQHIANITANAAHRIVSEEEKENLRRIKTGVSRTEAAKQAMRRPKSEAGRANIAASNRKRAEMKRFAVQ